MVYAIKYDHWKEIDFHLENNEDWFNDEFSASSDPGYPPPHETPIVAYMGVVDWSPLAPPSVTGAAYIFFCDQKFKAIVEALEPGVHDFVPMELRYGTPEKFEVFQYYLVRSLHNFNPIDVDNSDLRWLQRVTDSSWFWKKKRDVPFTLKRELTEGRHLWSCHGKFISDEIHDEIKRQNLATDWAFEKQLESTAPTLAD